jgi:hypothetical protein
MHHSLKAVALGFALVSSGSAALAAGGPVMTFAFAAQGQCMAAQGFTQDFDPQGFASLGWQTWQGTLRFDFANHKAYENHEGTFFAIPPAGAPEGSYPVILWRTQSECVLHFTIAPDFSFTLESTTGCPTGVLNGPGVGSTDVVTDSKSRGRFSRDMDTFVIGSGGPTEPVVQTLTNSRGYQIKRICTGVSHGIRIPGK